MDLTASDDMVDGVAVLSLRGEADLATLPRLHERVSRFVRDHLGRPSVIDLDGLGHLDPVATGVLVGARLQVRAGGAELTVVCTNPAVASVFQRSGLDATFTLHGTIAEAATSARAGAPHADPAAP